MAPDIFVEKRDGRRVQFDVEKIYKALLKATEEVTSLTPVMEAKLEAIVDRVIAEILERFPNGVKIYEIQNVVEHELLQANEYAIAESYITYRTQRDFERSKATDINFTIGKLLNKDQAVVNENANKDSDVFNTQRDLTAGIVGKSIGLKMLPKHVANAHQKGDIHYHDLDYSPYTPMTNCCLIDFEGMLRNGFKIGNAEVESPKSIQTATAQISQIIANVASSQYGGCSADRIDEVLAPYAEKRTTKNTWQMPKSGCFLKSKRTMLGARLKKISMMPCNRWNMRSIPSLPRTDKLPLLRLALVLEPIASSGKSKRRFWKLESRDLDRNIGQPSFQN